jgi:hypothetical protein
MSWIYGMLKNPTSMHDRYSSAKFSGHVSHPCFICFATRCLLALLTDVSGGRIRTTRNRLIVGLITSHLTYLTITKIRKGRPRPGLGCRATDSDDYHTKFPCPTLDRLCCFYIGSSHVAMLVGKYKVWWPLVAWCSCQVSRKSGDLLKS